MNEPTYKIHGIERRQLKKDRAKTELKIKLLKVVNDFKSEEEPNVELNEIDIINVLSSMISRRTE